jgi:hypothetical protein
MNQPVLAWIVPVQGSGGLHPEHPIYNPPGVWPSPGYPSHPIAPGGGPSQGPGFPTHPIAPGGLPPGVWPPPGYPAHPIAPGGEAPVHPIVLPPEPPPTIWPTPPGKPPGGVTGTPSQPINLPPTTAGGTQPGFWAEAYFEQLGGWVWVWVPVPTPGVQPVAGHPSAPSSR